LDQGRCADRLASIPVRAGDVLDLQIVLCQGDAHYDITNVQWTIACADGSASWDLARDVVGHFLASNPLTDSRGNAGVWRFADMAGSHRLVRMPAVDALLARGWDATTMAVAAGKLDHHALEAAARQVAQAVAAEEPDSALTQDLTGPRSPFRV